MSMSKSNLEIALFPVLGLVLPSLGIGPPQSWDWSSEDLDTSELLPHAPCAKDFREECVQFPNGARDDYVDATTQVILRSNAPRKPTYSVYMADPVRVPIQFESSSSQPLLIIYVMLSGNPICAGVRPAFLLHFR